mmetsp:Transcript_7411/g.9694  ORF Transcript_7411/g.9694 Transcript_7411/m.9694 type:complete len:312 (+) Transcript_7411:115-1050(+)
MGLEETISAELIRTKQNLLKKAKGARLQKDSRYNLYIQSRKLWDQATKYEKAGKYDVAFYSYHLYVRLVLENNLHRREGHPETFYKVAKETLDRLLIVEIVLERCYKGIRLQIQAKYANLLEKTEQEKRPSQGNTDGIVSYPTLHGGTAYPDLDKQVSVAAGRERTSSISTRFIKASTDTKRTRPTDFRVVRVDGDGHCAFRAIAQGQANGELSKDTERAKALDIRKAVVKQLLSLRNVEMMETGLTVEQVITMDLSKNRGNFTEYIRGMAGGDYAGEVELWILAKALNLSISVFKPENKGYLHMVTYGTI